MKTETATPANMSNMFTLDEEKVEKRSTAATVKIVRDDEAELLLWTDNKLGRCIAHMQSWNHSVQLI